MFRKCMLLIVSLVFIIVNDASTQNYMDGFPLALESSFRAYTSGATPIIADFNKDGTNEILLAVHKSFTTKVFLIAYDGSLLNGWPVTLGSRSLPAIAAGDVDNDGRLEAVIRDEDSIFVLKDNGLALKGFPVYLKTDQLAHIALYDFNNDHLLEIVTKSNNLLFVIDHSGSTSPGWPVRLPGEPGDRVVSPPMSIGDIDKDGYADIVVSSSFCDSASPPCKKNFIHAFSRNGQYLNGWPIEIDSGYGFYSQPASIHNNIFTNSAFIYLNTSYVPVIWADSVRTRTMKISHDGKATIIFRRTGFSEFSSIALSERNDELYKCFGTEPYPAVLLNDANNIVKEWPVFGNGYYYNSPLIAEFEDELIFNVNHKGMDTSRRSFSYFYKGNGSQTNWSPLRPTGVIGASGAFCDLNLDNQMDFVLITTLDTSFLPRPIVHAWTFPGVAYHISKMRWPMYAHDRYRTNQHGFIPPDEPVGIQPVSTLVPDEFELHQNYPNPFNSSTTIRFSIRHSGIYSLKVYNSLGQVVSQLFNKQFAPGSYKFTYSSYELASGVYFYELSASDEKSIKKFVVLK